ncbi:hypothetical protein WMY93_023872 [Mugilogobius chulae]|uniref:Galactosyltransferase C-terminal domain-containing protein n=1 Tax=Mugilogobius chulae TaxID=88201 RepID=A0AAW0NHT8_9GOBI
MAGSDMTYGGFNWKLNFRWYPVPQREMDRRKGDRTLPVRTPTMAGGLFSIDRDYFQEIGTYDAGMDIWGGENLEISFRIWQCGGTLEIVTCSHVGHVFRKATPYTFPGGTGQIINKNNRRLAEVWMDEFKNFFYIISPGVTKVDYGDITSRSALRQKLSVNLSAGTWRMSIRTHRSPDTTTPWERSAMLRRTSASTTWPAKRTRKWAFLTATAWEATRSFLTLRTKRFGQTTCVSMKPALGYDPVKLTLVHVNSNQCLDKASEEDSQVPSVRDLEKCVCGEGDLPEEASEEPCDDFDVRKRIKAETGCSLEENAGRMQKHDGEQWIYELTE